MTFDRISFRYEILDAQVKDFLQSYNFIFVAPVESSKFQIKVQRYGAQLIGRDCKLCAGSAPEVTRL